MSDIIICDIDECFCQTEFIFDEIEKLGLKGQNKWAYFHANVRRCVINPWCVDLVKRYAKNHTILFLTARSEVIRDITIEFISKHLGHNHFILWMRRINDFRLSHEVKSEHLQRLQDSWEGNILFAIDDEEANCEMFREAGIYHPRCRERKTKTKSEDSCCLLF